MASVHEVIETLRTAPSNAERGAEFEKLMVRYFQMDPVLRRHYDQVWRWTDWPDHVGADTGIDLVARERESGELTAIQCKFYEPTHTLAKSDIDSFFTASGKKPFTNRIIISTTDKWGSHAEEALADQVIPVQRLGMAEIAASPIDWKIAGPDDKIEVRVELPLKYDPKEYQKAAIEKVVGDFAGHDRGKLIMACGTGKTFTALKIAERWAEDHDGRARVLFLVPSISLLSQTLREWENQVKPRLRSFAVCSDAKVSRTREDIKAYDMPVPVTTDAARLAAGLRAHGNPQGLTVVFSTYQSIQVIHDAQHDHGVDAFDLIICDEAHRTTGVTLQDADESNFVRVHDNDYVSGAKRLYMTATPRIFDEKVKTKAEEYSAEITSMDDEETYGPEFYRLGFGDAVGLGLLTDYKVLVLTVDEEQMSAPMQEQVSGITHEINLDDASKIVGCWNGLAKRAGQDMFGNPSFPKGATPMKRAVAFARDIASSKRFAQAFEQVIDLYDPPEDDDGDVLTCQAHHVDGSYNALRRNEELNWLKAPVPDGECRILSNARCLSEGVDVPALDAVLFVHPRNSVVDVVQSVGRVMRLSEGKQYGYIILPVGVPAGMAPEQALADNRRFRVVWQVLNALRAHDDRFNALVNSIELNQRNPKPGDLGNDQIMGGHIGPVAPEDESIDNGDGSAETKTPDVAGEVATQTALFSLAEWRNAIYARLVKNVGTRRYWEDWAADVAQIAGRQRSRIRAAVDGGDPEIGAAFTAFCKALRDNLNDSISEDDAISMLSQHLITKPIFDALFEGYSFASHNPVAQVMQTMADTLDGQGVESETRDLESFYDSVRIRASEVSGAAGKQQVVNDLYERFFKLAFAKQAESLGIVYTPVQIVDFLLRAADEVMTAEFGRSLSDEGVHILDGFAGTGTFLVRLIQSGIIKPHDLARKYAHELHANEIMLLAYYIAAVNIEAAYHGEAGSDYEPFPGIILTDTFQISEHGDRTDTSLFPANNDRITAQLDAPIQVIVGNPPYSVGQGSANDNNANVRYPTLDNRIEETYAACSTARSQRTLYDSYVRALRWATDRIGDHGVIAFVSNGGWIDGNTADGIRLSLADEFSALYVYNLRGNQRSSGEQSRKEGGKVFGGGSRNTVAMLIAVRSPDHTGPCRIQYRDIGDYLSREEKLKIVEDGQLATIDWTSITPNQHGDWINQRNETFNVFPAIGDKKKASGVLAVFSTYSLGLATGRDAWAYNFSRTGPKTNISRMIDAYNAQVDDASQGDDPDHDPTKISWNRNLKEDLKKRRKHAFDATNIYHALYRPFVREYVYFSRSMNAMVYRLPSIFPTPQRENIGFYVVGVGSDKPFCALMTDLIPDLALWGSSNGQFFARWTYEKADDDGMLDVGGSEVDEYGYRRWDNITDGILADYQASFGPQVIKDDIFFYVYAVLHSPQYRTVFAADLKKMLPRIPKAADRADFAAFAEAGAKLSELHVGYEDVDPYPLVEKLSSTADPNDRETFRVTKMKWRSKSDHSVIVYNGRLTLEGIPEEAHRYVLGSRTALDWLIDRYQVKVDKPSGIVNDPNDWCDEHDDPRYIVDLIKRVTRVSVETMRIVDHLPELPL